MVVTASRTRGYHQLMIARLSGFALRRLTESSLSMLLALLLSAGAHAQAVQRLPVVEVRGAYVVDTTGWPLSARKAAVDSLAAGRRRWQATRLERYRLAVYLRCGFCGNYWHGGPTGTQPAAVVRGSKVLRVVAYRPAGPVVEAQWMFESVDALFAMIEREANDPARQLPKLRLDPTYGFPRSWETDDVHNGYSGYFVMDAGYRAEVALFEPDTTSAHTFLELGGGWNYPAPAAFGDNYSHGYSARASIGREIAPRLLVRLDAFRSQFDHNVQFYPPCAFPGCTHAYFSTESATITGVTANGLLSVDPRGILYVTAGAGFYDAYLRGNELHAGASAGAGLAVPLGARLRAVVEARYHALLGATNGPPWIVPITVGLRY